jgi:ABC-type phosphate/phosphonate transport system substrate-binding protein
MKTWILSLLLCFLGADALAADDALTLAVNEGTTYRVPKAEIKARYDGIAEDLTRLLHHRVQVEPVVDYAELSAGLAQRRFVLAYVHPAQIAIRALRSGNYRLVALTKGYVDYRAAFLVPAASPLHTLADLKGRKLAAPDQDSITSWLVRATRRDALGADTSGSITYTRYQDAIPFMLEQGFADVGCSSSPTVVKAWLDKGGRVIGSSKAVPIKELVASSSLTPEQFKAVQDYFLNLEGNDAGRSRLQQIQSQGFIGFDETLLVGIGQWLGV